MLTRNTFSGIKIVAAATLLILSGQALATTAYVTTYVNRVMTTSDTANSYGGCMAYLASLPAGLSGCAAGWVTFDCAGAFGTDPVRAYRMVDQAQLALTTDRQVTVFVDDTKKSTVGTASYCFAYRIDTISR